MVQLRVVQDLHNGRDRACLRIVRAIYQALDASMHQSAGAHGARFNCNKEFAVSQTVVTNGCTGFAQGHDLSVSSRIRTRNIAIPSAPHDTTIANHNRAYRNFPGFERALGAAQSFLHPEFVGEEFVCDGF